METRYRRTWRTTRKRIFTITAIGKRALKTSYEFKVSLWKQYPDFAGKV